MMMYIWAYHRHGINNSSSITVEVPGQAIDKTVFSLAYTVLTSFQDHQHHRTVHKTMKRIKVGKLCRKPGAAASVSQNDQRTRKAPSALNSTEEDKETATDGTSSGADYMSDTLLNTLSEDQSATTAVKRGRWDESNTKKQDEEEEDGHDYTERLLRGKSQRKSMEEFRDEGLDKQISSSNKVS